MKGAAVNYEMLSGIRAGKTLTSKIAFFHASD